MADGSRLESARARYSGSLRPGEFRSARPKVRDGLRPDLGRAGGVTRNNPPIDHATIRCDGIAPRKATTPGRRIMAKRGTASAPVVEEP